MVNRFIGPLLVLSILVSSRPVAAQGTTIPEALARHGSSLERSVGVWSGPPPSVESLLSSTDLVVRGVVTQTRSYLSPNQRDVYTDYEIRRPRVLYRVGSSSDGRPGVGSMTVTLLGGTIELNGLTFKAVHKGLPSLPSGEEHILLLRQSNSRFFIAGDYFGAFRVVGASNPR